MVALVKKEQAQQDSRATENSSQIPVLLTRDVSYGVETPQKAQVARSSFNEAIGGKT
jgi:hypothetical protein